MLRSCCDRDERGRGVLATAIEVGFGGNVLVTVAGTLQVTLSAHRVSLSAVKTVSLFCRHFPITRQQDSRQISKSTSRPVAQAKKKITNRRLRRGGHALFQTGYGLHFVRNRHSRAFRGQPSTSQPATILSLARDAFQAKRGGISDLIDSDTPSLDVICDF